MDGGKIKDSFRLIEYQKYSSREKGINKFIYFVESTDPLGAILHYIRNLHNLKFMRL